MSKIIEAQIETGQPYMLYKDSINEKSNQKPAYAAWGRQDSYQPGHRHIKKEKEV